MTTWTKIPGGGYHWQASRASSYIVEREGGGWSLTVYAHSHSGSNRVFSERVASLSAGKSRACDYERVARNA